MCRSVRVVVAVVGVAEDGRPFAETGRISRGAPTAARGAAIGGAFEFSSLPLLPGQRLALAAAALLAWCVNQRSRLCSRRSGCVRVSHCYVGAEALHRFTRPMVPYFLAPLCSSRTTGHHFVGSIRCFGFEYRTELFHIRTTLILERVSRARQSLACHEGAEVLFAESPPKG